MSLTSVEQAIYKRIKAQQSLILGDPELRQQLTGTPVEEIAQGVNGLSRKGLILIKKAGNRILYQAVSKDEAKRTGTFEHDEGLVYAHIKDAGNMGAWTRPLKMATNLHQTSFNKAIKGLESKMAIKLVKSVKWPTRKIYMLANVTPSVELTGGPWYSDGGLDQAFIDGLLGVCLNYVKKLTFPRKPPKSVDISDEIYVPNPVYPPSHTKRLPSPAKVLEFIVSSGISQQTLAVEHVMQLMNVLVYNGEVEILKPPSGTRHEEGWNSDLEGDGGGMADKEWKDEVARRKSREKEREKAKGSKKRARGTQSDSDTGKSGKSKGRSKSKASSKSKTDSDSGSDSDKGSASDASSSGGGSARRASLSATSGSDSGTESDDEKARAKKRRKKEKERELKEREKRRAKEKEKRRRKKEKERKAREREREREKKRKRKEKERKEKKRKAKEKEKRRSKSRTAGSDSDDSDSDALVTISDKKKRSKKRLDSSDSDSSSTSTSSSSSSLSSSSDSDSDSDSDAGKKKSKSAAKSSLSGHADGDEIPGITPMLGMYDYEHDIYHDTDVVYRAVHPTASNIEWGISEAPCVQCPVHLFCSETGPVNPAGCVYYDNWLGIDYV